MRIVYEPKGRALEYSPLAVSLYRWCSFKCSYCFVPAMTQATEHGEPYPRKNALSLLEKDCDELQRSGDKREILISFTTDPYQPLNDKEQLTRKAIELFIKYKRPFSVLTKGGHRSMQDFDLMAAHPELGRYATTLTCNNHITESKWEPFTASYTQRITALVEAHKRGIKTWVSIEPIIDPAQSLALISITHALGCVDLYRIGLLNHEELPFPRADLYEFVKKVKLILEDTDHVFKKDLQPFVGNQ
jgi:DNA repair photolyase